MWCWTGSADLIFWFYSWFICFCSTSHYDAALNNKPLISGRIFRSPVAYTKGMTGLAADEPQGVIREPIELCLLLSGHRHGPIRLCFQFFRTQSFIFFLGFALHCEQLKNVLCSLRHWQGKGVIILCCLPLLIQWYLVSLWRKRGSRYREKWENCSTFPSFFLAILSQIRSRVLHLSRVTQRAAFG